MNLATAITAAAQHAEKLAAPKKDTAHAKSRAAMKQNMYDRWKKAFDGQQRTTAQLAGRLGYSYMGSLCSLYRLEKAGKVEQVGRVSSTGNKPTILWQWKGE